MEAASKVANEEHEGLSLEGIILDIGYLSINNRAEIRITFKAGDGKAYDIFDPSFKPYFYFLPTQSISSEEIKKISILDNDKKVSPTNAVREKRELFGKPIGVFRVYVSHPSDVPKLSLYMQNRGQCFEYDIPFARRYALDNDIIPFQTYKLKVKRRINGTLVLEKMGLCDREADVKLNVLYFDIETYNKAGEGMPRADKDPVIMLSYVCESNGRHREKVITFKNVDLPFVEYVKDEKALFARFIDMVNELDIDIISGYNSTNFDIKYMQERAKVLGIEFNLSRGIGSTKIERHGLVDKVKIGGRIHIDMYLVVKFIAIVGAAEHLLKINNKTLKNVYEAISTEKKIMVDKKNIFRLWDGTDQELKELAHYNLNDSQSLRKVYETFMPIMVELSKTTGNVLNDTCISTSGQLVEYTLMRFASTNGEIIPNKPTDSEMKKRLMNPIEGAYVKTPNAGIYDDLAIFDFRSLYPSLIISYNIDPSTICTDCTEYYESPIGTRFTKKRRGITPTILLMLVNQRKEVKKAYKREPSNISIAARSQALKIVSNSFFGYLGYARSRWYSRECAGSITAYARHYIKEVISQAEQSNFNVIYADTDSCVMVLSNKTHEDALNFVKEFNSKLPEAMELELEDFYKRGVFVGKKSDKETRGAKKKYALITASGRIKIRGFELVRRDWSKIARETQREVLETILKEGSPEKAVEIVKNVIKELREGKVPLSELVISTQLRKNIDAYDAKSPELAAAKKAIERGQRTQDEVEHSVIGYVITKHGNNISDKAELEELAKDYDPEYYINNQVIPATMRILKELNFSEDELKNLGTQKKL